MLITENLDHLFGKKHFSAVNAGGFVNIWRDLNSGLLVFNPSKELFNELINILENGSDWEGDQDILQKYDTRWSEKKELNLGYQYNMFVTDIIDAKNYLSFTLIENIKEINNYPKSKNNIKVVHYANHKPWDEPIGPYDDMYYYYKLWYDIYNTIQIK